MLNSIINKIPLPKFIIIEDSLEDSGEDIFNYIVNNSLKQHSVHYFVFSGRFESLNISTQNKLYDFTSDIHGWISKKQDFNKIFEQLNTRIVIVIDSLAHMILQYDIPETYRLLNYIKQKQNIIQVITLLHTDLLMNSEVLKFLAHLCTLYIVREPKFNSKNNRVSYLFKKPGGKIIKQIEEYFFEGQCMVSTALNKVDAKAMVEQNIKERLPENLTTFKISLDEKEKESKSKVVLPYLPKEVAMDDENSDGKIIYKFDEVDDWDEEDPDDDLDI